MKNSAPRAKFRLMENSPKLGYKPIFYWPKLCARSGIFLCFALIISSQKRTDNEKFCFARKFSYWIKIIFWMGYEPKAKVPKV